MGVKGIITSKIFLQLKQNKYTITSSCDSLEKVINNNIDS